MKWTEWLDRFEGQQAESTETEASLKVRRDLEKRLGRKLPPGTIVEGGTREIALDIHPGSSEQDVANQLVETLKEMTKVITTDLAGKFGLDAAKIKMLAAEEYYRQATAPATFTARNFGDKFLQ